MKLPACRDRLENVSTVVRVGNDSQKVTVAPALARVKDRYGAMSEQMVT